MCLFSTSLAKPMIRKYRNDDTDVLVSIWQKANALAHAFLPDDFVAQVAEDMRKIYLPNAETWVLTHDETPIGFIALIGDEIGGLFLDPAFHGNGHGKALVDHAVELKGPWRVEVFRKNTIGRRFYDRYGFFENGQYTHEPSGEVTIRMSMHSA
jgi:putative acetyltransferase